MKEKLKNPLSLIEGEGDDLTFPFPFQGEGGVGVTLNAEDNPHPNLPPKRGKESDGGSIRYKHQPRNQTLKKHSRRLRRDMTDVERKVWHYLRRKYLGTKFRRQYPIATYVVDFVCLEKHLIIELDGGQHAMRENKDQKRDAFLRAKGFTVLRFWNNDVIENFEGVMETIYNHLSLTLPHEGGGNI